MNGTPYSVIGESWVTAASDPYEPDSREATYWHARHKLTAAARVLNEKLVSSDITPELAQNSPCRLSRSPLS